MHSNMHSATQFLSMGHFSIIFASLHSNNDITSNTYTRSGEKRISENRGLLAKIRRYTVSYGV